MIISVHRCQSHYEGISQRCKWGYSSCDRILLDESLELLSNGKGTEHARNSLSLGENCLKVGQSYLLNMKKTVDNSIDFVRTYPRWIVIHLAKTVQNLESAIQLIYHFYLLPIR